MNAFILTKGGGPPQERETPPVARQGFGNARAWTGLERNDITSNTRWAAYAARRRLRRKRAGSAWPAEVFA